MESMIKVARELAREKHASIYLPDEAQTSMFEHISEVAELVERAGGTDEMIAAAWLHDTVEDTDVTLGQIKELFGTEVRRLVDGLTDPADFERKPLKERKQLQADRIRNLDDDVKRIKLCDQLSNVRRVTNRPPLDWSEEKQWTYIQGARKITLECRGLWPDLDAEFDIAYEAARQKFGRTGEATF